MAMEQLEVPSKSYLIRWVECPADYTIHWSVKPHKKSLNFGLFRHPGSRDSQTVQSLQPPQTARSEESSVSTIKDFKRPTNNRQKSNEGDAIDRLHAAGLLDVYWHGKCEAEKVTTGFYQIKGQGGMFALVFDNTFSKQISKTATFVLLTYPSNAPPPASHAMHTSDANHNLAPPTSMSAETLSVYSHDVGGRDDMSTSSTSGFHTGILKKRKRKRHQGYARRFFSLDFTSSTLSYYLNKESSALRGAIPLSLAVISATKKDREMCIDSGAEIWHLRANSDKDWDAWTSALEKAAQNAAKAGTTGDLHTSAPVTHRQSNAQPIQHMIQEEQGWAGVEALLGRVSGIRDAVRRLASTNETPANHTLSGFASSEAASSSTSVVSAESADKPKKQPFWKRKTSTQSIPSTPGPTSGAIYPRDGNRKSITAVALSATSATTGLPQAVPTRSHQGIEGNLQALLTDLDSVVGDFSKLVAENKQRRWMTNRTNEHPLQTSTSRMSMDSTLSEEFFDAEDAIDERVVMLNDDEGSGEDSGDQSTDDEESDAEDDNFSEPPNNPRVEVQNDGIVEKRELTPLPLESVSRRVTVPEAKVLPPSLIGFLRKNVGKDLSTIAMPVSANEPISLLQRSAEQLEYSELLDLAVDAPIENGERLLYIAAFAISSFSNSRVKERSIRKPFNPMLGETFELIREDKGFRFLAEKVSHRPVIMAIHADAATWTFSQSPQPTQKFWGKSAELNTSGRVRIVFPSTGDSFSYTVATSFLRNIIAGEKYVEPTGNMHIHHENTGEKAIVAFKANKGMFAGRSEDVSVSVLRSDGSPHPLTLIGKWTDQLTLHDADNTPIKQLWSTGPLVDAAPVRYGFTRFAAQLNEITSIEKGIIPATDSRIRPDQRMVETGHLDDAEEVKLRLEEAQRQRRKEQDEAGQQWVPKWFTKHSVYADEEVWKIKDGAEGYWKARASKDWSAVQPVFE
ncbi:Oxysterol-binding protein-domain-containing protein [Geopyxis carbonaria]|nr:Oxysterol-binding protein-domain-containing protein [Geopyxis carbonaria]